MSPVEQVNDCIFPVIGEEFGMIACLAIAIGLLLAFTLRNPYLHRSPYVVKWSGR